VAKSDLKLLFGLSVKSRRTRLGISQEGLAERAGLHPTYVSDIECGKRNLSLESMTAEQAVQFDAEMQALLLPFAQEGLLTFQVVGEITWGKPLSGES